MRRGHRSLQYLLFWSVSRKRNPRFTSLVLMANLHSVPKELRSPVDESQGILQKWDRIWQGWRPVLMLCFHSSVSMGLEERDYQ